MRALPLSVLLCAALFQGCQSARAPYQPVWIPKERAAPPAQAHLPGVQVPAQAGPLDAEAASLQVAAQILGRPLDLDQARFLSGVGLGAWSTTSGSAFRGMDAPEPHWISSLPTQGLRATFLAAKDETTFLGGLREQLAAGRPVLLNAAFQLTTPLQSQAPAGVLGQLDLALLVIGYEPGFFTVLNPTGLLKQGPKPFKVAEADLARANATLWGLRALGWSHGFTALSPVPPVKDLRPALEAMAEGCIGSPDAGSKRANGSHAILRFSDYLSLFPSGGMRQAAWNALAGQIRLMVDSRKWAGDYLARCFPGHPDLQEASQHLLVASDDYARCLSDFSTTSLTDEALFAIGGILRDGGLRERSAGEALHRAAASPQPIWWRADQP
jgi:hypothetical protein